MRIAVMGAGGMGGWLGAKLSASGRDVCFIARGAHLEALRTNGLRVSGADSVHLTEVIATDRPEEIGTVDVVLFCVKLYDTASAASALAPLLGPETFVVTVQLVDLERGRRLELEGLSGAVVRLGRQTGVPTPVHATVYAALKPFIDGVPDRRYSQQGT